MPALAYLVSQYPAVNHVFMLREVRLLRERGVDVRVASVRPPDRPTEAMTEAEREEAAAAYYLKAAGLAAILRAHCAVLAARPAAYVRGLACALAGVGASPVRLLHALAYFTEALLAGRWMQRHGLSHLHTHFASGVALIVARTFPVTMSATFHGPAEFECRESFRLAEKIRASRFCCAISRYGLSQLMYAGGRADWHKLEVTPLGVNLDEFAPRPESAGGDTFQLLSVGRLAPVKGQYVLLEALEAVVREGHDVSLRLAGDGPDRAALAAEAVCRGLAGRVKFEGNLNQDRLRAVYREADAFALASFGEGLPVVLMEAMAMEIPCIATWVAGVPELIRDGVDGLLVPAGDAAALAHAIVRLKADAALRRRLAQSGRQRIVEGFDLARNGARLYDVFERRLFAAAGTEKSAVVTR